MNEDIKDIIEILELAKEEIENNDENITVTLDLQDLKSLKKLYDLYNKEKEKNKVYTELLKQNENRAKIKTCMTHNLPDNAEIICMIREDFERNFGNDYISKDKIREKKNADIKTNEHTILGGRRNGKTLEYGIRLGRIQMCEELLEERN